MEHMGKATSAMFTIPNSSPFLAGQPSPWYQRSASSQWLFPFPGGFPLQYLRRQILGDFGVKAKGRTAKEPMVIFHGDFSWWFYYKTIGKLWFSHYKWGETRKKTFRKARRVRNSQPMVGYCGYIQRLRMLNLLMDLLIPGTGKTHKKTTMRKHAWKKTWPYQFL